MLRRCSLTVKMLLLTALVGLLVWAVMDTYQSTVLEGIFRSRLAERFSLQAENQRTRFDRYIKRHHQAVKLFVNNRTMASYVADPAWRTQSPPKVYRSPSPWLPGLSVIRSFIQPRYLLLLDGQGVVREIYQAAQAPPPPVLMQPDRMLLSLSHNQVFLTRLDGTPYLVASADVTDGDGTVQATLMLASPLDEEFLLASQGSSLDDANVIALLADGQPAILVSSNTALVPPGTPVTKLKDRYLATGQGFFDYGATDTLIELMSFVSTREVSQLTHQVLQDDRRLLAFTAIAFIGSFVLVMYLVIRRIRHFTANVVAFSRNLDIEHPGPGRGDEIAILEERFHWMAEAVRSETAALEYQAMHDTLTELPNRNMLHSRLQHELLRIERSGKTLVLILSDLNHFKEINDTLGHHIGDRVLQQAATRLSQIFRKSDSVARLGGDEFGILLSETGIEQAIGLVERVVSRFDQPFIIEGHSLSVGISMGLVECPTHGNDVNILLQHADVAMYMAKRERVGYSVYDPREDTHSVGRLALMSELREAIENHQLDLYYQPKIDVDNNCVIGVEALLRWDHPQRGRINPDEFIPLAEQTGLIKPLSSWVLGHAVSQCAEWRARGLKLSMSINLSVYNLHDVTLLDQISTLIQDSGLDPASLTLEITESGIMTDPIRARETLEQLSRMGVILSIDDFGTGYSSLSYLKQLPVNEIKIDRSFVMEMTEDEDDAVIVRATIDLVHNLGLAVVAEGVKDEATWAYLRKLGCDVAQGFYISEPLPADRFEAWLASHRLPSSGSGQG